MVDLKTKVCHCNDPSVVVPESPGTTGSGSAEDPFVVDRAESPLEYYTPPIVAASPITTPLEENSIPLPVRVDLGSALSSDSGASSESELGDLENRPHCCRSARLVPSSSTALVEITPEDELVTPVAVQQAIVRARYSGRSPRLIDETWGMRRSIGYGRASDGPAHAHPPQLATRGRRKALSRRLRGVEGAGGSGDERISHSRPASPGGLLGDA